MNQTIINCTPHKINVVSSAEFSAKDRKYIATEQTTVLRTIEPSGILLNCKIESATSDPIDGIATIKSSYPSVDAVPINCDYVICSAMYVAARQALGYDTSMCLTVGDVVYSSGDIKPIGTLNLRRN